MCAMLRRVHVRLSDVGWNWIDVVVRDGDGAVDRTFLGVWVRFPDAVAGENGRYFLSIQE